MILWAQKQKGFTIVELLIVVVVIAILAAITIVAYNGVQNRAKNAAIQSTTSQAGKKIATFSVTNSDEYPAASGSSGIDNLSTLGIVNTADTTYQYSANNSTQPKTFCLTVTTGTLSYYISSAVSSPTLGGCPGHSQNGIAAITNFMTNPSFEVDKTGWTENGGRSTTVTTDWSQNGSRSLLTINNTAGAAGLLTRRANVDIPVAENDVLYGSVYTRAYAADQTLRMRIDWFTSGGASVGSTVTGTSTVVTTTTTQRITVSGTAPATAAFARFAIATAVSAPVNTGYYIDSVMITKGADAPVYADGSTNSNWAWNGTAHNSTSTGPPL